MTPMRCVQTAWHAHQAEIRGFLRQRADSAEDADDLLQDLYLKALSQGDAFCALNNPRAWLFQVARHALVDRYRLRKEQVPLPDDLCAEAKEEQKTVDRLSQCLPRVLAELAEPDRQAIVCCDLHGMSQRDFAAQAGLSLVAAKSRLQRARQRLQAQLVRACQVVLDENGAVCGFVPRPPLDGALHSSEESAKNASILKGDSSNPVR